MDTLQTLYDVICSRKTEPAKGSYTCYLFEAGLDKILKKVGEECSETIIAAKNNDNDALVSEVSDLLYHLIVTLVQQDIKWSVVEEELARRSQKIGNLKASRNTDRDT